MAHIKLQILSELSDLVVSTSPQVKLKEYHTDLSKYTSLNTYMTKHSLKKNADEILESSREQLIAADEILRANKQYGVLVVLQGMDTAGKDGIISHVLSGLNPQGCNVASFKVPTAEEHAHNFLWRYSNKLPKRGEIVIFNRSHYEDVLVTKVHPTCMETLPDKLTLEENKDFWDERYDDINNFEKHLSRNGILIIKIFLHISKDEQKVRLLARLANEDKLWKISSSDFVERTYWDDYIKAYEEMLSSTSTKYAPWLIIPANDKKIARAIVADLVAHAIHALEIKYPSVTPEDIKFFRQAKKQLETETS